MAKLHKVLQEILVESDYADQYVETLKSVRDHTTKTLKEFDTIIEAIKSKKSDRLKLLQAQKAALVSFLDGFEEAFAEDPLAKRKGF